MSDKYQECLFVGGPRDGERIIVRLLLFRFTVITITQTEQFIIPGWIFPLVILIWCYIQSCRRKKHWQRSERITQHLNQPTRQLNSRILPDSLPINHD